jgi:hypothetical protein
MEPDFSHRIASLAALWDRTEMILKRAESLSEKVTIPAIVELRYAGRRILDIVRVLTNEGDRSNSRPYLDDNLQEAERLVESARHDGIDSIISYVSQQTRKLDAPSPDLVTLIKELETLLIESRVNRSRKNSYYEQIEFRVEQLLALYETRQTSLSLEARKQSRRIAFYGALGSVVSIILFSMTLIISLKGKMFDWLF